MVDSTHDLDAVSIIALPRGTEARSERAIRVDLKVLMEPKRGAEGKVGAEAEATAVAVAEATESELVGQQREEPDAALSSAAVNPPSPGKTKTKRFRAMFRPSTPSSFSPNLLRAPPISPSPSHTSVLHRRASSRKPPKSFAPVDDIAPLVSRSVSTTTLAESNVRERRRSRIGLYKSVPDLFTSVRTPKPSLNSPCPSTTKLRASSSSLSLAKNSSSTTSPHLPPPPDLPSPTDTRRKASLPEAALKALMSLSRRGSSPTEIVSEAELRSWRRRPSHLPEFPSSSNSNSVVDAELEVLDRRPDASSASSANSLSPTLYLTGSPNIEDVLFIERSPSRSSFRFPAPASPTYLPTPPPSLAPSPSTTPAEEETDPILAAAASTADLFLSLSPSHPRPSPQLDLLPGLPVSPIQPPSRASRKPSALSSFSTKAIVANEHSRRFEFSEASLSASLGRSQLAGTGGAKRPSGESFDANSDGGWWSGAKKERVAPRSLPGM